MTKPERRQNSWTIARHLAVAMLVLLACGGGGGATPPDDDDEEPTYTAGTTYFGTNEYIEYIAGDLPLIFTAPHGGLLAPESIPVRTQTACGTGDFATVTDANTQDLARRIRAVFAETGRHPHIIINRLSRSRLDANRAIGMAACGNADAERAWNEYHDFVAAARAQILDAYGKGWYTDLHGHGHAVPRLELGYGISASTLRLSDAQLDASASTEDASSIRVMSELSPISFAEMLRGPQSLGTLFAAAGYPSVPSQDDPAPDADEAYFSGGYNTTRYGCSSSGPICGVQIEMHYAGVRDTPENRQAFAEALKAVYDAYLQAHYGIDLP